MVMAAEVAIVGQAEFDPSEQMGEVREPDRKRDAVARSVIEVYFYRVNCEKLKGNQPCPACFPP
jgi:hypothetical protein